MKTLVTFFVLVLIKLFGNLFYQFRVKKIGSDHFAWNDIRLIFLMNHTSLFEPIYISALPLSVIWKISRNGVLPGADITMSRPVMGWFFRLVTPNTVSISRRRDKTWNHFLERISPESIILIAPEGRMKRPNGLDKMGKPMTVRGGIFDLLEKIDQGKMLIAYSGGLHHIMTPDEKLPRLFKKIRLAVELIDIQEYKRIMGFGKDSRLVRLQVAKDFEQRRDRFCPEMELELKSLSALRSKHTAGHDQNRNSSLYFDLSHN